MTDLVNGQEHVQVVAYDPALDPFTPLYAERDAARESELLRLRDTLAAARVALETAQQAHREDVAAIGAALIYAANHRDERVDDINGDGTGKWCGEYDTEIAQLNETLTVKLPVRLFDYTAFGYVRVQFNVRAQDNNGARREAHDVISDVASSLERDDVSVDAPDRFDITVSRD